MLAIDGTDGRLRGAGAEAVGVPPEEGGNGGCGLASYAGTFTINYN